MAVFTPKSEIQSRFSTYCWPPPALNPMRATAPSPHSASVTSSARPSVGPARQRQERHEERAGQGEEDQGARHSDAFPRK